MSFERPSPVWPPPPRGVFTPDVRTRRCCAALEALALLHVVAGLAWPLIIISTRWLDRWLPGIAANRYWCALLGPTIAGFGLLLWFITRHGMRRGQRWACDAAIAAILVWLPLDLALSFALRFVPGMTLDSLLGLLLLGLLLAIRTRLPLDGVSR